MTTYLRLRVKLKKKRIRNLVNKNSPFISKNKNDASNQAMSYYKILANSVHNTVYNTINTQSVLIYNPNKYESLNIYEYEQIIYRKSQYTVHVDI